MAEQLQIQVQANVSNAITNLNNLQKNLAETNTAAVKTGTTGMQTLSKGAGQANTAMINLGRTVSDAPFGFIGIANNIGPLVENFVQLRKESGGTGSALKQLGASLAGPGGLIVGIQLAVAAIQFAQLGFSRWGASSKKAKEDTDKLKQANEALVETVSKQRLEFETLVKVAKDVNQTELARAQALKRLNEILPDTIGKLNQQNIATEQGAAIIRDYIKAVEAKATAELLSGRIAANNVKIFDAENKLNEERGQLQKIIVNAESQIQSLAQKGTANAQSFVGLSESIERSKKRILEIEKESNNIIKKAQSDNEKLRSEYEKQIPIVNTLNDKKEKTAKVTNEITELLKKYREELAGINWDEQNRQIDGTNERVKLAGDTLRNLYLAGVKETSAAWQEVNRNLKEFQAAQNYRNFRKGLEEVNNAVKEQSKSFKASEKTFQDANTKSLQIAQNNIKIILGNYKQWELANKQQIAQQQQLAATINDAVSPAIDSVINAFAQGEDPFEALAQSVRQLIAELAKAVIKSLILKAITSAIAPGAGTLVGGAGSGLMIRGDMLRNITLGR
jgi:hypothetical protein